MEQDPDFERLARLDRLARRMDRAFRVPGLGIRIGYDSILGLIPGFGDIATLLPAGYIVLEGRRMGAPLAVQIVQVSNIGIDALIGSIPLVGDLFDVGWKANMRNVALLRDHVERRAKTAPAQPGEGRMASHHPGLGGPAQRVDQPTISVPAKK